MACECPIFVATQPPGESERCLENHCEWYVHIDSSDEGMCAITAIAIILSQMRDFAGK